MIKKLFLAVLAISMSLAVGVQTAASAQTTAASQSSSFAQFSGASPAGYWLTSADGGIFTFGNAPYLGSNSGVGAVVVGMAATPDGKGYWLVSSDGGVFAFGDAQFFGSATSQLASSRLVGMAATPDGKGYWLVSSDGGVFAFGDAQFFGSMGGTHLNQPVVGMAADPATSGYWLVAADGGIFSFNAPFFGSTGNITLNRPIVGMAATPDGMGYQFVASDGGVFTFGDAQFFGSMGGTHLNQPVVGMAELFNQTITSTTPPTPPNPTSGALSIVTTSLPLANVGNYYATTLQVSGGTAPYTWSATGLPNNGLSLVPATGQVFGVPTFQSQMSVTFTVQDSTGTQASATLQLSVDPEQATVNSPNWAGYTLEGTGFSYVTGTFTVPALTSQVTPNSETAEWVGIDGSSNTSLIQAGVAEQPSSSSPSQYTIRPWWEILPAPPNYINSMTVSPGDSITVTIQQLSGFTWSIYISDANTGSHFLQQVNYYGPMASAEWIVEAPTFAGSIVPLAAYYPPVVFTNTQAQASTVSINIADVMVQNSTITAQPTPLTSNGFSVAYTG